jgi:hypothetical protein
VLAMDMDRPMTIPAVTDHPNNRLSPKPSNVVIAMRPSAPGMATERTFQRSWSEKCKPTPNIRKMTPNSAS